MADGDKTDILVEELGYRMEDPVEDNFTNDLKLKALNHAQLKIAQLLDRKYLSVLEESEKKAMTATALLLSALGSDVLNGGEGIIAVRDELAQAADDWLTKVRLDELPRFFNSLYAPGATNKVYWVFDEKICVSCGGGATDDIFVYYMKEPSTMTTDNNPDLYDGLFDILLKFAEAYLWTAKDKDANIQRRDIAYAEGMEYIDYMNMLADLTRPRKG